MVMQAAEDSMLRNVSEPLNGAIGGCIFVSGRCVLILLYYSESLTQNDEVVEALASDRSDQPFGKAILPGRGWCDGFVPNTHAPQTACNDGAIVKGIPLALLNHHRRSD